VRFVDVKRKVDLAREALFLTPIEDGPVPVNWDHATEPGLAATDLTIDAPPGVSYEPMPAVAAQAKHYTAWKREFTAWLAASQSMTLYRSPSTGLISAAGEAEGQFRVRARLEERLRRAQQAAEREEQQAQAVKYQSAIDVGTTLIGALFGRKSLSRAGGAARSVSRVRKESADVARSADTLAAVQQQLADLQSDLDARIAELHTALDPAHETLEPIEIRPKKTHIAVRLVALVWSPVEA
jgi:hypothetical protein